MKVPTRYLFPRRNKVSPSFDAVSNRRLEVTGDLRTTFFHEAIHLWARKGPIDREGLSAREVAFKRDILDKGLAVDNEYLNVLRNRVTKLEQGAGIIRSELDQCSILDPRRNQLEKAVIKIENLLMIQSAYYVQEACAETGAALLEGKLDSEQKRSVEQFFQTTKNQ